MLSNWILLHSKDLILADGLVSYCKFKRVRLIKGV